jgi:GT2 family glycosyltransferase
LILIDAGDNRGYAAGNNIGLRYGLADPLARYFWILNHDTVVDPAALTHLCARFEQKPDTGMCGSKLYYFGSNGQIQALGGSRYNKWFGWNRYVTLPHPRESDLNPEAVESQLTNISGASMLVSRAFVETAGGMCEDYFLYFEELDWFLRAEGRYELAYAPHSIVYHKHGASLGGDIKPGRRSLFSEYYLQKNKITFTRKFFPLALPSVYLGLLLAAGNSIIGKEWQRFSMIIKIMLGIDRPPGARA